MDAIAVLRVAVSLAVVLGVIWFARRRLSQSKTFLRRRKAIDLVGKQSLGQKASAVVIESDGTRFLLGVTEHGVTVLDSRRLPPSDDDFSELLEGLEHSDEEGAPRAPRPIRPSATAAPAPLPRPRPIVPGGDPLSGSLLSAQTWRRSYAALKRGFGR